jgi:hypothetical protein
MRDWRSKGLAPSEESPFKMRCRKERENEAIPQAQGLFCKNV